MASNVRVYQLWRKHDIVGWVVETPVCTVLAWGGPTPTTTIHPNVESVRRVHVAGHEGTRLDLAFHVDDVAWTLRNHIQDHLENTDAARGQGSANEQYLWHELTRLLAATGPNKERA